MSASVLLRGVSLALGVRHVLVDVDLGLHPRQRIGLVGPNGVGKSTLLRVIAGRLTPEGGSVSKTPPTATIGYLEQEVERRRETVAEFLARRTGVADAQSEFDASTAALSTGEAGADERYNAALEQWLALGVPDYEVRVHELWAELDLPTTLFEQSMLTLSGGQAARVGLAAIMASRFDVLLLDEPTNDLDLDSLARLEQFVRNATTPIAVVSHDRTFLRNVVTDVAELDEFTHRVAVYAGGYDAYVREREVARQHALERWEEYESKRNVLADRAQREREWATQAKSKAKKRPDDNDKFVRNFKINQTEQLAGRAARTEKAIERLEVVDSPREPWELRLTLAAAERSGSLVARLDQAVVDRGSFRLGPLSIEVSNGDRIVIVGPNGAGKSTLLGLLVGDTVPDTGTARVGSGVRVGRLAQARHQFDGPSTTLRAFQDVTGLTTADARTLLAKFRIGAEHVHRPTATLSAGERTRLVLALFMAQGSNCLVLDEPTNHLDLPAIEQLETAIDTFPGTVLLVSHDRTFLEHVRRTRTIELRNGLIVADTTA